MAQLLHYISVGQQKLRCGYTTGTCAAAAALGAATRLMSGAWSDSAAILTPAGIEVQAELLERSCHENWAQCAVCKDGGDDPDVTDGELIFSRVSLSDSPGVTIDGGDGVGRVTKPGLDQPVGAAAINSVPRDMIKKALEPLLCEKARGFNVVVSVPNGEALALRTFNPRLGIVGGISILGTSGIVRPMSEAALIESIRLEIHILRAAGKRHLLLTPGNYGEDFSRDVLKLNMNSRALCSNYIGQAIDCAVSEGFESVLLVGHLGKLIKVAGGSMNTHSSVCDGRRETICAHAALCGADTDTVRELFNCVSTDAALEQLKKRGLLGRVMESISVALYDNLKHRAGQMEIQSLFFSNKFGVLGTTAGAEALFKHHSSINNNE